MALSTENYDRLTKVARLDYSDQDASLLNDLKAQLASLKTACASFSGNTGVEGATHAAMTSKVSDFEASIVKLCKKLSLFKGLSAHNSRIPQTRLLRK